MVYADPEKKKEYDREYYRKKREDPEYREKERAYNREYNKRRSQEEWAAQKAELSRRNRHFLKQYGLTVESYNEMLGDQGGVCAICGEPPNGKHLAVDHCHTTEKVRGLLCSRCNPGIAMFRDDVQTMLKAIDYLNLHGRS